MIRDLFKKRILYIVGIFLVLWILTDLHGRNIVKREIIEKLKNVKRIYPDVEYNYSIYSYPLFVLCRIKVEMMESGEEREYLYVYFILGVYKIKDYPIWSKG